MPLRQVFGGLLMVATIVAALLSVRASTTTTYPQPATGSLSLMTFATLPLQLSAGPNGATISASSPRSPAPITATAGGVHDATSNNTVLTNPNAQTMQARLVFQSIAGATANCLTCQLQLRQGATTTNEITVTNGVAPAAGTAGPWVTIQPSGTVGSIWYIWADAKATLPTQNAVISFWLEISPNNAAASPKADYLLMQMTFVV
jgi:hypothetical protein